MKERYLININFTVFTRVARISAVAAELIDAISANATICTWRFAVPNAQGALIPVHLASWTHPARHACTLKADKSVVACASISTNYVLAVVDDGVTEDAFVT